MILIIVEFLILLVVLIIIVIVYIHYFVYIARRLGILLCTTTICNTLLKRYSKSEGSGRSCPTSF